MSYLLETWPPKQHGTHSGVPINNCVAASVQSSGAGRSRPTSLTHDSYGEWWTLCLVAAVFHRVPPSTLKCSTGISPRKLPRRDHVPVMHLPLRSVTFSLVRPSNILLGLVCVLPFFAIYFLITPILTT